MKKCELCNKETNIMALPPFCEGHLDVIITPEDSSSVTISDWRPLQLSDFQQVSYGKVASDKYDQAAKDAHKELNAAVANIHDAADTLLTIGNSDDK